MEYWQEGSTSTALPPTSVSDTVGKHYKTRGITFRAALIKHTLLIIYKQQHIYILNIFLTTLKKRNIHAQKVYLDIWPLFLVKLTHQPGLMEVTAIISEVSRSEIFLMKFYSFCTSSLKTVVHQYLYSQKLMTWVRSDCEVMDIGLW